MQLRATRYGCALHGRCRLYAICPGSITSRVQFAISNSGSREDGLVTEDKMHVYHVDNTQILGTNARSPRQRWQLAELLLHPNLT